MPPCAPCFAPSPGKTCTVTRGAAWRPGRIGVYVSEAVVSVHGLRPGMEWPALSQAFRPLALDGQAQAAHFYIACVWRDYARQTGAVVLDHADWLRLTGHALTSDLALWPHADADLPALRQAVRGVAAHMAGSGDGAALVEFVSSASLRERSLRIFDRSFAVTYWLQAVAVGIGLFGVAASFSAQVLARRKEFGLLALCAAVVASGTLTAWLAGRTAAGRQAVLAVKEDW